MWRRRPRPRLRHARRRSRDVQRRLGPLELGHVALLPGHEAALPAQRLGREVELEIHHLTLLGQLLALAAVAVAEDVLEPVSGTWFCLLARRRRRVLCVVCARRRRARRPRPCVCVSDGAIATVSPPRRHRGDAVPATATTRVHPRSRHGGDGMRGSCALEPTPSRERRRVKGAKADKPPRRRANTVIETTARRRRRGARRCREATRSRQFTPAPPRRRRQWTRRAPAAQSPAPRRVEGALKLPRRGNAPVVHLDEAVVVPVLAPSDDAPRELAVLSPRPLLFGRPG